MATRRIYRLEHAYSRKGPYQGNSGWWPEGPGQKPCLEYDGPKFNYDLFDARKHHFAFANREQMLSWMGADGLRAARAGFVVGVYEIDEKYILDANHQCVFVRDEARHVGDVDPFHALGAAHGPVADPYEDDIYLDLDGIRLECDIAWLQSQSPRFGRVPDVRGVGLDNF